MLREDHHHEYDAHYALSRISLTADKYHLRMAIHSALEDPDMRSDCKGYAEDYLRDLFNLKREYLRLWDQENGDYERYVVMNRYDALAREVLDLDRHVFMSVGSGVLGVGCGESIDGIGRDKV